MAKNSSIGSRLYLEYFSGMACNSNQRPNPTLKHNQPTDPEKLDVVQNMVVEGKIIAGNTVDAGFFLYFPVFSTETLPFGKEVFL